MSETTAVIEPRAEAINPYEHPTRLAEPLAPILGYFSTTEAMAEAVFIASYFPRRSKEMGAYNPDFRGRELPMTMLTWLVNTYPIDTIPDSPELTERLKHDPHYQQAIAAEMRALRRDGDYYTRLRKAARAAVFFTRVVTPPQPAPNTQDALEAAMKI